jgi:hypothetical protein
MSQKLKAALAGLPFVQLEVVAYCAAGLWWTGGFLVVGVAFALSNCPFSMTIMKGFGVYDAGSP